MIFFFGVTFVFVLIRLRLYIFVEAAALRLIVLRFTGDPIATRVCVCGPVCVCFFLFIGRCRFFQNFFVPLPLSLCMENTSYVIFFQMVFVLPCDHGLDFLYQLCENSINQI